MNSELFVPCVYERKIRCVRALLHVATLNGGNLVVPRLMGVLKASVPLFIDVTGKKRVAGSQQPISTVHLLKVNVHLFLGE